jgi:hypothetical protein
MFPNYFIFNNNSLLMQLKRFNSRSSTTQNSLPNSSGADQTKSTFSNLNVEELINLPDPNTYTIELKDEHGLEMYKTFTDFSTVAQQIKDEFNKKETPLNTNDKYTFNSFNSMEPRLQFRSDTQNFFLNNDKVMESLFLTRGVSLGFNKNNTNESINPCTFMENNKNNEIRSLFSDPSRTLTANSISKLLIETLEKRLENMNNRNNLPLNAMKESTNCLTRLSSKEYKRQKNDEKPKVSEVNFLLKIG